VLDSVERMPGIDFVFRGIKDPTKAPVLQHGPKGLPPNRAAGRGAELHVAHDQALVQHHDGK
jgi:hypothetical protein